MWLKLSGEFLNLGHVLRARFSKGWKNGQEEWLAEVEALVQGEIQVFCRYRGADAAKLMDALEACLSPDQVSAPGISLAS
jgi:hypothetical protein